MVFWKEKQNWKPLVRLTKKKRGTTQINKRRNQRGEITTDTTEKQKKKKENTMICQQIGKLRRNGQVSRNTEPAKIDKKKDNLNRPITRSEIQSVVKKKKIPCKQKYRTRRLHCGILPNIHRRTYTDCSQTHLKEWRGNPPKVTNTLIPKSDRQYQKRKSPKVKPIIVWSERDLQSMALPWSHHFQAIWAVCHPIYLGPMFSSTKCSFICPAYLGRFFF